MTPLNGSATASENEAHSAPTSTYLATTYVIGIANAAATRGEILSLKCPMSTSRYSPTDVITKLAAVDSGKSRNVRQLGRVRKVKRQFRKYEPTVANAN